MNTNVIDLVKGLTPGPCTCQYNMGSCSIPTYDYTTGKSSPGHYDRGPCTHRCMRCKARAALEADGIEYVKDDSPQWGFPMNLAGKVSVDSVSMMPPEGTQTFVVEGTYLPPGITNK